MAMSRPDIDLAVSFDGKKTEHWAKNNLLGRLSKFLGPNFVTMLRNQCHSTEYTLSGFVARPNFSKANTCPILLRQ